MAVTLFFGGVTVVDMLVMLLFLMVTALACSTVGIFCSALFSRTVTATVMAYLTIFALGIGTILFPLLFQYRQLVNIADAVYNTSSSYGGMIVTGMNASNVGLSAAGLSITSLPKLLFINPAVGMVSLLMNQTGLLRSMLSNLIGYRGDVIVTVLRVFGFAAVINMITLTVISLILMCLSALFIKPAGIRARKRK